MQKLLFTSILLVFCFGAFSQNVGIGTTTPHASAKLEVASTNSGFLPPRMTYAQRNAISSPAQGLIIYCTDCGTNGGEPQYYNGTKWLNMSGTTAAISNNLFKYMTFTPNASWNYQTDSAGRIIPYTLTSTTLDTSISGKTYHIFNSTDTSGTSHEYYNITGRDYYQYNQLSSTIPASELHYLNDSLPVGANWKDTFSVTQTGITFSGNIRYTVDSVGVSAIVNGTTYTNLIRIKTDIINYRASLGTAAIPLQNIFAYYAPRYGMVKSTFQLHVTITILFVGTQDVVNTNTSTTLVSSSNIP